MPRPCSRSNVGSEKSHATNPETMIVAAQSRGFMDQGRIRRESEGNIAGLRIGGDGKDEIDRRPAKPVDAAGCQGDAKSQKVEARSRRLDFPRCFKGVDAVNDQPAALDRGKERLRTVACGQGGKVSASR